MSALRFFGVVVLVLWLLVAGLNVASSGFASLMGDGSPAWFLKLNWENHELNVEFMGKQYRLDDFLINHK
ncbi:hypothetical protein [Calderihabitans maritimus]|uniref:Uncharacterized protein n=1 Tax=Calderihabitans maritimus TaxID=1246530 RepID=A0A1Z5HVM8_9FIRM|nr:hypothetical protein [Calderihabitans maritimus]GAW93458.1 hypothetical protein KKC1_25920 [Calderihabitans maritimus]